MRTAWPFQRGQGCAVFRRRHDSRCSRRDVGRVGVALEDPGPSVPVSVALAPRTESIEDRTCVYATCFIVSETDNGSSDEGPDRHASTKDGGRIDDSRSRLGDGHSQGELRATQE